jgi:hypothetical protein
VQGIAWLLHRLEELLRRLHLEEALADTGGGLVVLGYYR